MTDLKKILIEKINASDWWHVPPRDSNAYEKRGKFLTSTYAEAEFYGRPNNDPEKVYVANPLFGFSEMEILEKLFGGSKGRSLMREMLHKDTYQVRTDLDAKMCDRARHLNYDAIVLMTASGKKFLQRGIKPKSIELNLMNTLCYADS